MAGTEVERLTRQAERLRRAGRNRQAAELYRRALRRDPFNPTARQELDSLSVVDEAEDRLLEDPAAQVTVEAMERAAQAALGDLHAARQRWEAACDCYRTAIEMDGSDPVIWAKLGRSLARTGRWREAAEALDQALVLTGVDDAPAPDTVAEPSTGGVAPMVPAVVPEVRPDPVIEETIEPDPPAPARLSVTTAAPIPIAARPINVDLADWPLLITDPDVLPPVPVTASDPVPDDFFLIDAATEIDPIPPAVEPEVPTTAAYAEVPSVIPASESETTQGMVEVPMDAASASFESLLPAAYEGNDGSDIASMSVTATTPSTEVTGMTVSVQEAEPIPVAADERVGEPAAPVTDLQTISEPMTAVESAAPAELLTETPSTDPVETPAVPQLPAEASVDTSAGQTIAAPLPTTDNPTPAVDAEGEAQDEQDDFDEDVAESTAANDIVEQVPAAAVLGEEFNPRLLKRKRKRKERTEAVDLSRRGTVALRQRNLTEAIACFSRLTELLPNSAKAHRDLGAALLRADRLEEAAESLHHALELRPKFADAYASLADCYHLLGRLDRAVMCYRQTLALRPGAAKAHSNLLLTLNYHHKADPQLLCEEHLIWYDRHARPLEAQIRPHENDPDPARVIRVGYVSPDFRRHAVNFFFEPVLLNHDRAKFHLTCYSDTARPDDITEAIAARVDGWRDVRGMSDDEVAKQVREDRIDLLIDLAGHTGGNRLLVFARKPAPVQITWMGYPNTTGLPTMDWRITDLNADPPGKTEKYHTERMARLPRSFLCYAPQPEAPEITDPPMVANGYVTFGCFNVLSKVTPDVMAVWARILQAVPKSKLILKDRNGALSHPSRIQYVRDVFRYHGVTADRLDLRGKDLYFNDHLRAYAEVDITLDPFPYNGATTTCESLWMGVPVITLAGKVHAGRVGVSLLKTLSMNDFISETTDSYVRKATVLSANKMGLTNLRHSLRSRMLASPLTDGVRFAKDVEGLFRQMWSRWCKGQAASKDSHGDSGSIVSLRE